MRLISLELEGVCQHAHLHWEFGPGLIGIFGPNGSGKSNAINAGCYAALTNDYSRVCGGQPGAVRQQSQPEEVSRIVLRAEHQGTQFEITRQLSPGVKHQMIIPGEPPVRKAGEIQERLEATLGIQRRLIDDYVFVHQRALTEFLSATPAVRAKSFAHLCNTVHAEKCWAMVGDQIEADRSLAAEVVDDTDEIRQQIGGYESRRRELDKKVKAARRKLLKPAESAKYKVQVDKRRRYDFLREEQPQQAERVTTLLENAREAIKSWKARLSEFRTQEVAYRRAKDRAVEAQKDLDYYTRDKELWEHKEANRREMETAEKAEPKKPEPCKITQLLANIMAKKATVEADLERCRTWLVARDSGEAACENCGAMLQEVEAAERFQQAEEEVPKLEAKIVELLQGQDIRRKYDIAITKYEAGCLAWRERVNRARQHFKKYAKVVKPEPIDQNALEQAIQAADDSHTEVYGDDDDDDQNGLEGTVNAADRLKEQCKSRHQEAKGRLAEIDKGLSECVVSEEDFEVAKTALWQHTEIERDVQTDQARLDEVKGFIKTKEEELKRTTRVLARSQKARGWIAALEAVREVLHRDQLPRVVHHNALLLMQDGINNTLAEFDSPFRIAPEEDLSLTATFPDGTVIAGEGLSGGQQAVLALAFRWTLGSLFASQVGMLVLDEPTAGLDDRNLDCLENALIGLGHMAKARGYQVVIITHEERLERVFDQVLTLEKPA